MTPTKYGVQYKSAEMLPEQRAVTMQVCNLLALLTESIKKSPWRAETMPKLVYLKMASITQVML